MKVNNTIVSFQDEELSDVESEMSTMLESGYDQPWGGETHDLLKDLLEDVRTEIKKRKLK